MSKRIKRMSKQAAIKHIDNRGILLVFPIKNDRLPRSLWFELFPRTEMRWEWDEDGDNKVFDLWRLMKELSDCRQVIYSKWYKGRATFFSRELFTALLCDSMQYSKNATLSRTARNILDTLESDSPLSTKELKSHTGLEGKMNTAAYNRSLKELYSRFLIVTFGEVDDGAFPSNAIGATKTLYEEIWSEAEEMDPAKAQKLINTIMPLGSHFRKFYERQVAELKKRQKSEEDLLAEDAADIDDTDIDDVRL